MNKFDICQLIPQRSPILLVDRLLEVTEDTGITSFTVPSGHYFLEEGGSLSEMGVMEHIAQSASALAGYQAQKNGKGLIPIGYIGEVRDFVCYRHPHIGEEIKTIIRQDGTFGDITCINGETWIGNEKIAEIQLKIQIREQN